jgi:hypothetical protein
MSLDVNSSSANSTPPPGSLEPPNLRPARFEDYPQIVKLESSHQMRSRSETDWRALWEENPLWPRLQKDWPIGWVLEDSGGAIVGSIVNVPSIYQFGGRELICANGRAWVCANEYRGFAVLLMDEYFNQPNAELFINTTVGPVATQTLDQYAIHVPLGDWNTIAFCVTEYRGFARAVLERKGMPMPGLLAHPTAAALRLKEAVAGKSLSPGDGSISVELLDVFDSRFDSFWEALVKQNPGKLLAERNRAAMAWHFLIPKRIGRLWIYGAMRDGLMRAYCIVKRDDHGASVRRMRIVDYQNIDQDHDLLPQLVEVARQRCVAEGIHMLEHLGCGLPKMKSFDDFAPYRRRLGHWPFYYQASGAKLLEELKNPAVWDPSSFDGDSSLE